MYVIFVCKCMNLRSNREFLFELALKTNGWMSHVNSYDDENKNIFFFENPSEIKTEKIIITNIEKKNNFPKCREFDIF